MILIISSFLTSLTNKMGTWNCPTSILLQLFLLHSCLVSLLVAESSQKLYIAYMGDKHHRDPMVVEDLHHDILTSLLGSKEAAQSSLIYSYKHGFSGFAAMLTDSQAKELSEVSGVIRVSQSRAHRIHTTRSWNFLNININHPSKLLRRSKGGEDVIIGFVDTGIWPESPSFSDSGYTEIPARWRGTCNTSFPCNRKLIGARFYTAGIPPLDLSHDQLSPRDLNGHGTLTASIAAGTPVPNATFQDSLLSGTITGGAPNARIAVYKALWGPSGSGNDATVLKAVDDAIHDGVDVLSMSLAAVEDTSYGTLHAVMKGVVVVFAGGNDGPMPMGVTNSAPWVITVAASTVDRAFPTELVLGNNRTLVGQAMYAPKKEVGFQDLVVASSCNPEELKMTNVTGKVVVCPTGSTPQSSIVANIASDVVKAGAVGLIVAQYAMGTLDESDPCMVIPCVLVDFEIGTKMADYALTTRFPVVKIRESVSTLRRVIAPKVAGFSSRGPSTFIPGIIKPDIAAPGVNILASSTKGVFMLASGTSIAAPHVSGIIALLKAMHPSWSPAALKSALITTAKITTRHGFPITADGLPRKLADPFDFGGGHVNPNCAADPGLVYDMDANDFKSIVHCPQASLSLCTPTSTLAYHLNLPSISIPNLYDKLTLYRTVTNVGDVKATYNASFECPPGVGMDVEPSVLIFDEKAMVRRFRVRFWSLRRLQGDYVFGSLSWIDGKHCVRSPIAVRQVIQEFYSDVS